MSYRTARYTYSVLAGLFVIAVIILSSSVYVSYMQALRQTEAAKEYNIAYFDSCVVKNTTVYGCSYLIETDKVSFVWKDKIKTGTCLDVTACRSYNPPIGLYVSCYSNK